MAPVEAPVEALPEEEPAFVPTAASPAGRLGQRVGRFVSEADESATLTQELLREYEGRAGARGFFMAQTDEERAEASTILAFLRGQQLSLPQLRELKETGKLPESATPRAGVQTPTTETPSAPAAPAEQPTPQTAQPRSVRNNNPGNLIFNNYTQGLGATGQDKDGFAIFESPDAGQQASIANLQNYGRRGINTVSAVINRWSPPNAPGNTKESTDNYVAYVAGKLGVDPNAQLDMNNQQMLGMMAQAIAQFESGHTSPLVGARPGQTADRVAAAVSVDPATAGVMYGPSAVPGGAQNPGVQAALALRELFVAEAQDYASFGMTRQAAEVLTQVSAIDLGLYKAQADQGIYELATFGDPSRAMSVLSQFTGTPTQALDRGDGTYDLYVDGRVAQTAVPVDKLADLIKTRVDTEYRQAKSEATMSAATKAQEERFKTEREVAVAMVKGTFDIEKERAKLRERGIQITNLGDGRALLVYPDGSTGIADANMLGETQTAQGDIQTGVPVIPLSRP